LLDKCCCLLLSWLQPRLRRPCSMHASIRGGAVRCGCGFIRLYKDLGYFPPDSLSHRHRLHRQQQLQHCRKGSSWDWLRDCYACIRFGSPLYRRSRCRQGSCVRRMGQCLPISLLRPISHTLGGGSGGEHRATYRRPSLRYLPSSSTVERTCTRHCHPQRVRRCGWACPRHAEGDMRVLALQR